MDRSKLKSHIHSLLNQPYIAMLTLVLATCFSFADRNFGYFFGIGVVVLLAWSSQWRWSDFGFTQRLTRKTVVSGLIIAICMYTALDTIIQPLLEIYFGRIDLSSIEDIRGDFVSYFILILIMWIFAAFGESLLFLGFYMKQFAKLFGGSDRVWLVSAIIIGVYFGASHSYQGLAGQIAVGLGGIVTSLLFYKNRDNLMLIILVHGFYDMIGLTLIYLNQDQFFYELVHSGVYGSSQ